MAVGIEMNSIAIVIVSKMRPSPWPSRTPEPDLGAKVQLNIICAACKNAFFRQARIGLVRVDGPRGNEARHHLMKIW